MKIEMKKSHKILITVVFLMCAIIGFVCLIGFTVGGRFEWLHLFIFICLNAVIAFLSILFINGKNFVKSKEFIEPFIILIIAFTAVSVVMYGGINKLTVENEAKIYDTKVEYSDRSNGSLHIDIGFYDEDGNMQEVWDFNEIWLDDDSCPDDGATITIEERQGGFGYPVFKIAKVNNRIEK